MQEVDGPVLCVDLDGTLVATDLLWESLVSALQRSPWIVLALPFWLLRGRAYVKRRLASASMVDFATLPYHESVVSFVRTEFKRGRPVVMATAADEQLAAGVSGHLGMFAAVMASDGVTNLKGRAKAERLVDRFGSKNFDYLGNSRADIPCWQCAAMGMTTTPGRPWGAPDVQILVTNDHGRSGSARSVIRALRAHQWLKNILLLVPLLAAHQFDVRTILNIGLAFVSLSLCTSGGYIVNDLIDVTSDRQHHRKRLRPFAAGDLSLSTGFLIVIGSWLLGFGLAITALPVAFILALVIYVTTTVVYSVRLKREPVVDVMVLAGLYVLRVIAGGAAVGIPISTWLLAFTLFISLSLAFLKRFIEVSGQSAALSPQIPGRGYLTYDATWLHSIGLTCAYLASVILAIYVNDANISHLYSHPERLLLVCPVLLFWATRTWLKAHRGEMHDDPVVAIASDPITYLVAAISAIIVAAAL
jgi:4-hydroxybenzoate polyprenyltransferase